MRVVWILRRCYKDGSSAIVGVYRSKEAAVQQARLQAEAPSFEEVKDSGQRVTLYLPRHGHVIKAYVVQAFDVLGEEEIR